MADPIPGEPRTEGELQAVQDRLDALSQGACDEEEFLLAAQKLTRNAPDAGWDLLSLLDQYYRRGRIKSEVFRNLKSRLEGQLIGTALDMEVSVPMPHQEVSAPEADATSPIAAALASETAPRDAARESAPGGAARELAPGDVLRGRYVIKSVLGRGGTGIVLEAIDPYRLELPNAGQRVAIKVLHPAISQRPELLARVRREFQRLQSLSHPNIVRAYDCDRDGETTFFIMECLSGLPLSRVLSARHYLPMHRSHALSIIRAVGAALAHAHSRGVVHGDLNPGNIFITNDGEIRVLDFGASPAAAPRFASCQLLDGEPADSRDDVYALACVVYLLLSGAHPFGERTAAQARTQGLKPARPSGLTHGQWRALRRGLAFERGERPQDLAAWLKTFDSRAAASPLPVLLALLRVSAPARRRSLLPALGAAGVAVLAAGWWVSAHFESVTRAAAALGAGAAGGFASAQSSLSHLWRRGPDTADRAAETGATEPRVNPPTAPLPAGRASSAAPPAYPAPPSAASSPRSAASKTPAAAPEPARASSPAAAPTSHAAAASAPRPAPIQRARIELAADTVEVPLGDPAARVVVRRGGNLHAEVSFSWWTESGTAKPGRDFAPVAPREEHIEDGKAAASLFIPVVADPTRRQPKSFYVVINEPSAGASLGARTLTMVTIPPSE